jgi:hypothetical protein
VPRRPISIGNERVRAWVAAVVIAAVPAGCGGSQQAAPAQSPARDSIVLAVRLDDGAGRVVAGRLTCRGRTRRASGLLAGRVPAARLCARTRAIAPLLTRPPPARRACTQIYGGPQTLRVTGTIDRLRVRRRFGRTNGCEIADFARVARALAIRL